MKWDDFIKAETAWFKERAEQAQDPIVRDWFALAARMAERHQKLPMGYSHNETCGCGCDHGDNDSRRYLYHVLSDPTASLTLGVSAYDPGRAGLRLGDFCSPDELRQLDQTECGAWVKEAVTEALIVVDTEETARLLLASSRHPLKKKLPILPFSFGHACSALIGGIGVYMDAATLKRFNRYREDSPDLRVLGLPPFDVDTSVAPERVADMRGTLIFCAPAVDARRQENAFKTGRN